MKRTLIVLDEPWDSALTDLAIKIGVILNGEVGFAVLENSPAHQKVKKLNCPIFYIKNPRKTLPLSPFLSLKKAVSSFSPDRVLTIRGEEMLFASILKRRFNFKLFRLHGEAKGIKNFFFNRFLHRNFVDGVILSSKKLLNEVVLPLRRIFLRGIVNERKFRFSREGRLKIRRKLSVRDGFLIGIIGRLDPVKGHDLFIKGLALLVKKYSLPVYGLILGEEKGVKVRDLKVLAERWGVGGRIFIIDKRVDNVVDYISACDLGVVSSKGSEMIARVPLEFMSCGRPVVVTNVGVLPEIVSFNFGAVVDKREEDIAEGIRKVLSKGVEKLGERAREEVNEKYSFSAVSKLVNEFIF